MPHWNRDGIDPELWIDDDTMLSVRPEHLQICKSLHRISMITSIDWDHVRSALAEHDKRMKEATP
jgi:hypothetical protein